MSDQEDARASRDELLRRRRKAINQLRATGMTDDEIEEALGGPLNMEMEEDDDVIDVEVVSADETHGQTTGIDETPSVALVPFEPMRFTEEWWETVAPRTRYRRCAGHSSRTGLRCKKPAMMGTTVCQFHGGASPHVQRAAKVRLDMASDRMAANLLGIAEYSDNDAVRLSATNSALDRAGIIRPTKVEIGPVERKPYEEIFERIGGGTREESRTRRGESSLSSTAHEFDSCATESVASDSDGGYMSDVGFGHSRRGDGEHPSRRPSHPTNDRDWSAEAAVARARRANAGMRSIESPHKRYDRP